MSVHTHKIHTYVLMQRKHDFVHDDIVHRGNKTQPDAIDAESQCKIVPATLHGNSVLLHYLCEQRLFNGVLIMAGMACVAPEQKFPAGILK